MMMYSLAAVPLKPCYSRAGFYLQILDMDVAVSVDIRGYRYARLHAHIDSTYSYFKTTHVCLLLRRCFGSCVDSFCTFCTVSRAELQPFHGNGFFRGLCRP